MNTTSFLPGPTNPSVQVSTKAGALHPEMPLHWHPPAMTVVRRPCGPATPGRAMQAALQLAADIERLQAQGLHAAADIVDSLDLADYVP